MEGDYLEQLVMDSVAVDPHLMGYLYYEMHHGVKVSNLAVLIAQELGEDEGFCRDISVAGLLHDIGKLWLAEIGDMREDTTLTVERMKIMRMHPTYSKRVMLREGLPWRLCEAVYCHHENMDGSGYPESLRMDQIPWMSRILRICDVFCALTSDRSYRRAFDIQTTMEIMIDEVENYDMGVFLAFQRVVHSDAIHGLDGIRTVLTSLQRKYLALFAREIRLI